MQSGSSRLTLSSSSVSSVLTSSMALARFVFLGLASFVSAWIGSACASCMLGTVAGEHEGSATIWGSIDFVVPTRKGERGGSTTIATSRYELGLQRHYNLTKLIVRVFGHIGGDTMGLRTLYISKEIVSGKTIIQIPGIKVHGKGVLSLHKEPISH